MTFAAMQRMKLYEPTSDVLVNLSYSFNNILNNDAKRDFSK